MSENRRAFLKCLGALGAAGVVLPAEALAFGRRRRAPAVCPPVYETGHVLIRPVPYTSVPGFHISYPINPGATPSTATEIPGKGLFCTWGAWNPAATPQITSVWDAGLYSAATPPVLIRPGTPVLFPPGFSMWAFIFSSVPLNTPYEIRYNVTRSAGPFTPPEIVPHGHAWFKCINDHPF
jgi:hypothetical protein